MVVKVLRKIKQQSLAFRLSYFLGCLILFWLPFAIPISWLLRSDPNLTTIATMGLLFIIFIALQRWWGKYVYQEKNIFIRYGFLFNRLSLNILIQGLAIGFLLCWSLFIIEAILGCIEIGNGSSLLVRITLEGLLSGLGIALAEELVFRGWILFELEKDCSKNAALWIGSLLFAIAHFIKPISEIIRTAITFPALFTLGLTLVWAKRAYRHNLAICIGIHGGLVWGYYIVNVGNLITYTNRVPDWITGIDGNPIAGLLGFSLLLLLALTMQKKQRIVEN